MVAKSRKKDGKGIPKKPEESVFSSAQQLDRANFSHVLDNLAVSEPVVEAL